MEKFLAQDSRESDRAQILNDSCDAIEEIGYTRRFNPDELSQRKEALGEVSIVINDIEAEKAEAVAVFKDRLKPLNDDKKSLLSDLKNKSEFVIEKCYKFIHHDERAVGYYNSLGELVSSRPIMPHEMQKTIFTTLKTGTEG